MTSPPEKSLKLIWSQPLGLWRARGASTSALRLGMGLPPLTTENAKSPDIDRDGNTLWHYWSESPRPLDLWSSVKSRLLVDLANQRSLHGEHPWHRLALRGHMDAMKAWAHDLKAPVQSHDTTGAGINQDTLFMRAAWSGNDALIKWLIGMDVDIHTADENGYTPLMIAIHRCSQETVQLLLNHGADPEIKDLKGRSAMHHAAQSEHTDLYTMIEDCGGDGQEKDLHGLTAKSILDRAVRTPQQAFITQGHWDNRYQLKLAF